MVLCSLLDSMVKRFSDRREKEKRTRGVPSERDRNSKRTLYKGNRWLNGVNRQ